MVRPDGKHTRLWPGLNGSEPVRAWSDVPERIAFFLLDLPWLLSMRLRWLKRLFWL